MSIELDPRTDPGQGLTPRIMNRGIYYRGQIIIEEGGTTRSAFYIESGKVEVSVKDGPHTLVIATLGPGEIVGEMALIEHGARSATVRAMTETVVTEISQEWLEAKIDASEDRVVRALLNVFVRRLRDANKGQMALYRKLAALQDRMTGLADRVAHTHIDQARREQFSAEAAPLLDAIEQMLAKYRQ